MHMRAEYLAYFWYCATEAYGLYGAIGLTGGLRSMRMVSTALAYLQEFVEGVLATSQIREQARTSSFR